MQTWNVNGAGLTTQYTDALGRVTAYSYDGYGMLVAQNNPDGSFTDYEYDPFFHTSVTEITQSKSPGVEPGEAESAASKCAVTFQPRRKDATDNVIARITPTVRNVQPRRHQRGADEFGRQPEDQIRHG